MSQTRKNSNRGSTRVGASPAKTEATSATTSGDTGDGGPLLSAQEIVRRYASKFPGYRWVNADRVALPLFRMQVRLLTITRKKVPPLQEFVLRAIGAGLVHEADIAGFLGLERDVVRRTLSELVGMDVVLLGGGAGDRTHRLVLTEQGRGTLNTLTLERADEETQTFFLDGLTRCLVPEPANPLRIGSDLRKTALIEIAPYPRTRPEADEFREQLVAEWGTLHPDSELVAVLGVERADALFRDDALVLTYRPEEGVEDTANSEQVGFVVGGHWSDAHAEAFRKASADSRVPLLSRRSGEEQAGANGLLPPHLIARIVPHDETSALITQLTQAEARIKEWTGRLSRAGSPEIQARLREEEAHRDEAQARLSAVPIRYVETTEYVALLDRALSEAKHRVLIVTALSRDSVVPEEVLRRIDAACRRGVFVFIGHGHGTRPARQVLETPTALRDLINRHSQLFLADVGEANPNLLVCDSSFYVASRLDWFARTETTAQRDRKDKPDGRGVYVAIPAEVNAIFDATIQRLRNAQ
jgi:DNA-binding MarR family transcriptional regulator